MSYISSDEQRRLLASAEAQKVRAQGGTIDFNDQIIKSEKSGIVGTKTAVSALEKAKEEWNQQNSSDKLIVSSGYRSKEDEARVAASGKAIMTSSSGLSFHETGLAFDIRTQSGHPGAKLVEFMKERGFYQSIGEKDKVHFVYGGKSQDTKDGVRIPGEYKYAAERGVREDARTRQETSDQIIKTEHHRQASIFGGKAGEKSRVTEHTIDGIKREKTPTQAVMFFTEDLSEAQQSLQLNGDKFAEWAGKLLKV